VIPKLEEELAAPFSEQAKKSKRIAKAELASREKYKGVFPYPSTGGANFALLQGEHPRRQPGLHLNLGRARFLGKTDLDYGVYHTVAGEVH